VKNESEVEIDGFGRQRIGESIEGIPRARFQISD